MSVAGTLDAAVHICHGWLGWPPIASRHHDFQRALQSIKKVLTSIYDCVQSPQLQGMVALGTVQIE